MLCWLERRTSYVCTFNVTTLDVRQTEAAVSTHELAHPSLFFVVGIWSGSISAGTGSTRFPRRPCPTWGTWRSWTSLRTRSPRLKPEISEVSYTRPFRWDQGLLGKTSLTWPLAGALVQPGPYNASLTWTLVAVQALIRVFVGAQVSVVYHSSCLALLCYE